MSSQERIVTVLETIISCVEAQSLKNVSITKFNELKLLRNTYEEQVLEKARNYNEIIASISF